MNKDVQDAKKWNQKLGMTGNSSGYGDPNVQEAQQLNNQSASSGMGSASNSTGYNSPDTQDARKYNAQSTSGSRMGATGSGSSKTGVDEAKRLNQQSQQNKGK